MQEFDGSGMQSEKNESFLSKEGKTVHLYKAGGSCFHKHEQAENVVAIVFDGFCAGSPAAFSLAKLMDTSFSAKNFFQGSAIQDIILMKPDGLTDHLINATHGIFCCHSVIEDYGAIIPLS